MRDDDPLNRTIADWELLFTNPSYLRSVGHGDISPMDREVWGWRVSKLEKNYRVCAYFKMVTAVLNQWATIQVVCSEPHMTDPIYQVASMAFLKSECDSVTAIDESLCEQFQRLWTESPRPHDDSLRFLAVNFGADFPISRVEIGLLFSQSGWEIPCVRIASARGWTNDVISMLQELYDRSFPLDVFTLDAFVEQGFPKRKALKWLAVFDQDKESVALYRAKWEQELISKGMTLEQIYAHTT